MPKPGKKKGHKPEPKETVKEEPPPAAEAMEVDEDEGGLGLGTKRKARKEKKQYKLELAMKASASMSDRGLVATAPKEIPEALKMSIEEPKPEPEKQPTEEVIEEFKGLGLDEPRKKKPKRKKTQKDEPAGTGDAAYTPAVAATPAAVSLPTTPASATQSEPQIPTSDSFPPPGFTARSAPTPMDQFPPPSTSGWGRGRGRGKGRPLQMDTQPAFPVAQSSYMETQPSYADSQPSYTDSEPAYPISKPSESVSRPAYTLSQPAYPVFQHSMYERERVERTPFPKFNRPFIQAPPDPRTDSPQPVLGTSTYKPGQFAQEKIMCRYKIPLKNPGRSVPCRPMTIITNYLEMTFKPYNISRYDVSFSPDRPKKLIPKVFKKLKEIYYPKELLAFDQMKNCYSLRPLHNVPATERFHTMVEIMDNNGRPMRFDVSLKATGVVELEKIKRYMAERGSSVLHPTEEVQCIDVILRQGTLESYVKAGRQFFKRPLNPVDLGHGYEMWTGLFQSAIFTSKAFVNIDVAHKGFPRNQSVIDCLTKDFGLSTHCLVERQRGFESEAFQNFVKGIRVTATLVGECVSSGQKREYVCNQLVEAPIHLKFSFNDSTGRTRMVTVLEYFTKEKKFPIKYPYLNCMWVGPREKSIFFPLELLDITYGQPLARQLDETQVAKMVKEAATPPDKRLKKITEVISSMKYSTNPEFKKFGLGISDKFYEVKSKILAPPALDVGHGNLTPRRGMWNASHLLKPEALQCWGFIAIETHPSIDFDGVIHMLVSTGKQMGMSVSNPAIKKYDVMFTSLHSIFRSALENGIKFLFVVVSTKGRDYYHKVKQMAEREVGMLTQCVKEITARRMNAMTAKNILLKVNSKLMGINQALGDKTLPRCLKDGGVMIVGADVTHPSPDQSNVPSIAAVTASMDPRCYMYNIELSVQTPKKEMIVEFEDMMFDHLKVYKDRNMQQLPRKIFVFRDGVSEGQFVQVMNSELAAVHRAYARMAGEHRKPEILFLLVQKRHHTRFFNKGENMQNNVEPGTVVDTDIVHQSELDFYLVSHQALKGTARPTRYHAVCNDGRIPDDEVEQLTYYLCHLYSRCMRAVSYPTPTYYAHLACMRARSLTHGQKFNNRDLEKKPERLRVLDKMLQYSRMFFV